MSDIYINGRFLTQSLTGVQRFAYEIASNMTRLSNRVKIVAPSDGYRNAELSDLKSQAIGKLQGHLWEQIELPRFLSKVGSPLLINLCNTAPVLYGNKISTIHDISFIRHPSTFSWKFRLAYRIAIPLILKTSKKIVTVSDFSRSELCAAYKSTKTNIDVIHNAISSTFRTLPKSHSDPYILSVSSLNRQKNLEGLVAAFEKIKGAPHKLYIAGGFSKNFAETELFKKISLNPNIKLLGRVSDEELVLLYNGASVFVYPSFYEGFGIPPIEAQACGCPVVVSSLASLPEVCGDSVLYCDPYDTSNMASQIFEVLSNPELSRKLVEAGFHNIKRFDWGQSARALISCAEKALKEN